MSTVFALIFSVAAILTRITPHMPNVVPIAALAIWSGAYLPKRWGWSVPVVAMLASDGIVGFYDTRLMIVVYGSFIVSTIIGWGVRGRFKPTRVLIATLGSSVFFFLSTNFAVWALSHWYAHTPSGLMLAYTYGLPFFRNTLLGDLSYSATFFGVYELVIHLTRVNRIQWIAPTRNEQAL